MPCFGPRLTKLPTNIPDIRVDCSAFSLWQSGKLARAFYFFEIYFALSNFGGFRFVIMRNYEESAKNFLVGEVQCYSIGVLVLYSKNDSCVAVFYRIV
jgi:hypothetical protein